MRVTVRTLRIVMLALVAVASLAACGAGDAPAPAKAAGPTASGGITLKLDGWDGKTLDFQSLRGKVVLVDVWATWCQPCVRSLPGLARLSKLRPDDLAVVGILSGDDPKRLKAFLEGRPVPYFVGVESAATRQHFSAQVLPTIYVVDRDGRVRDKVIGGVPEAELMRRASPYL